MDGEIILNRNDTNVMKLDDNEQALMDEIEITVPRPQPVKKQMPKRMATQFTPPETQTFQEDIDSFANPDKQTRPSAPPPEEPVDYGEYDDVGEPEPTYEYGGGGYEEEKPSPGYKTIDEEKADLVNKLGRLEKKGFTVNKRLNVYSPIDELRNEVKRITYSIDVDKSIKFSRRMLVACTTGLEFLNKKYNPFEIQLDGWSENVMENVDDYDEVFEELYVKYRTKMHVAPEVRPSTDANGRHEMQGPGIDISSLMGNIMMPPQPSMSTTSIPPIDNPVTDEIDIEDDISDIAEPPADTNKGNENGDDSEVREVKVTQTKSKRGGGKKKKSVEINL